jgi:diguanylate cyclase
MNIFNNRKIHIFLTLFIVVVTIFALNYFKYIHEKKSEMLNTIYDREAAIMQNRIAQMIYEKQKATIAIGIVLVEDTNFVEKLKSRTIDDSYYKEVVAKLRKDSEYKNIWVNIVDNNLNSVYRSWTDKRGDSLKRVRPDLAEVIRTKEVLYTISSGKFALAIKALVPVIENGKVVGVLELISHFNSIAKTLTTSYIDSVVLLNKEDSKNLQHPFTEEFLDGYYVANFDSPKDKLDYLQKHGIAKYFEIGFKVENGYIITSYPLVSYNGKTLGYYIMFKSINDISSTDEEFYAFKWIAIGFIGILILAGLVNLMLFYVLVRQKSYIKNIIDSSTNIVIINDKKQILDVNKAFFKYFYKEKNIEQFKEKYECVCDLFIEEEGYIFKYMDDTNWIDYILRHRDETNKVKIKYEDKLYYFSVGVALVSPEKGFYSAVFSDITREEMYKIELERLAVTDTLTGIGNRRFYTAKIDELISLAKRYKFPLSLIMLDIDHFKQVNDKHGHGVGDNMLIEYTKLIAGMIREADVFCRIGGEEFVIIVPHIDAISATKLAEKIRKKVAEHKVVVPITISLGVTQYIQGEDADHILTRVDEALYEAKENGRDQVVCK